MRRQCSGPIDDRKVRPARAIYGEPISRSGDRMPTRSYGRGHLWGMGSSVGALVSYGRGYLVYARCAQGKLILVCSTLRREKTRCRWRGMSISAQSRCSTSARDLPEGAPIEICQRPPRLALGFSCFFAVLSELRSHCHWQHPLASSSCTFAGLHVPIASEAGKVIKKTVMELGGSDAFIVCDHVSGTVRACYRSAIPG